MDVSLFDYAASLALRRGMASKTAGCCAFAAWDACVLHAALFGERHEC